MIPIGIKTESFPKLYTLSIKNNNKIKEIIVEKNKLQKNLKLLQEQRKPILQAFISGVGNAYKKEMENLLMTVHIGKILILL